MIVYPPPVTMSSSSSYGGGRCRNSKQRFLKKMTHVKTPKRQVVQWKQTNVQQGVVVVDEAQLSKLIKTEPIEKYYKLDPEPFATGLFANVRRCRSLETGEILAAKFSSRTRYGEDCTQEIHHEIALLSLCSPSPRIVRLHDVYQTSKEIIIVMEFAPGGDMQTIIDDNLVPYESDVVKFIQHVVEGLAYLHHRKIAHLDIKPQNLVMMGDFPVCDVKVCDFEISRVILEGTEIREILGTPEYVAPEILHYEPITLAADMWSLGVTTYVLLTGFSPFGGETDQETFCNISQAQLDFPDELFEDISEDAKDFIRKLLVRDPKARLTAKECLRHRWLANNRKENSSTASVANKTPTTKCDAAPIMAESGGRRVGCSSCAAASANEKNLRKYLSKSREALFERVISKQNDPSLRKSTLLSQYNKTRRLCESQMSLVSKSREKILMAEQQQHDQQKMSPSIFNKSREKLYGLRCLSKSHEVLNLYKSVGVLTSDIDVPETSPLGGILKTLTRAKTGDFSSMLPVSQAKNNDNDTNSSTSSVLNICDKINKDNFQTDDVEKENEENKTLDLKTLPECQPLQNVLNFLCINNSNNNNVNNNNKMEAKEEKIDNKVTEEISLPSVNITSIEDNENDKDLLNIQNSTKQSLFRPPPLLTKQLSTISSDDDPQSPEISNNDSLSLTEGTSESDISEAGSMERITGDLSTEEDEPRYTVQQLVSAYNLHQEIVTKSSLEVTMNAANVDSKLPPLLEATPVHKFPTGPNALRLFIPDIDIGLRTKKLSKKKTSIPIHSSIEKIAEGDDQNEKETETTLSATGKKVDKETNEKTRIENTENKADEKPLTDEISCITPGNIDDDKVKESENEEISKTENTESVNSDNTENKLLEINVDKEKHRLSAEITKNYLRSTSMSSDASYRSSGTSSIMTTSLEELIIGNDKKSRSNRSSGIASSDGDNVAETWGKSSLSPTPPPSTKSTTNTTATSTKGSDKNGSNSNSSTPRPNRKSFCSSRAPTITSENQKTRRKSSPIMKPFY